MFNTVRVSPCLCSGDEASRLEGGGRRRRWGGGLQLEVSEWTLPGPSVGDVTDEGVGASCQPPFVCEDETARRVRATCKTATNLRAAALPAVLNTLREAHRCSFSSNSTRSLWRRINTKKRIKNASNGSLLWLCCITFTWKWAQTGLNQISAAAFENTLFESSFIKKSPPPTTHQNMRQKGNKSETQKRRLIYLRKYPKDR